MNKRPNLALVDFTKQAPDLPPADADLLGEMLQAYIHRRVGSLRHGQKSVSRDIATIHEFTLFTQKAPWSWTEEDFDRWCHQLGVIRRLAPSSQRHYQSTIRRFLDYLLENVRFRNEVQRRYGIALTQICHKDNCIPHVVEREISQMRRALTHEEIAQLFRGLDDAIAEAHRFGSKNLRPLQRDKALFYTMYIGGLRIGETQGLDTNSFAENPAIPEFGRYGFISVWGKGSRGSGPKHRTVPVTHPALPKALAWYIEYIRPHFARHADPNDLALFLSERGRRMCISTIEMRFQASLDYAGLSGLNLTPHSLRHSSVTHEAMRQMSSEAIRRKHGHVYESTTQGYYHIPDDFVQDEVNRAIKSILGESKDDGGK